MKILFRKAIKKDYLRIAEIYTNEFSKTPYNEDWTKKKALKKINIFSNYCDIYVSVVDRKVVGFFIANTNFWNLGEFVFGEEMAIDENYQNKGIGKAFLSWIEKRYSKKGFKKFIFLSFKDSNAYKMYKKWGYEESKSNILFERNLK